MHILVLYNSLQHFPKFIQIMQCNDKIVIQYMLRNVLI